MGTMTSAMAIKQYLVCLAIVATAVVAVSGTPDNTPVITPQSQHNVDDNSGKTML